MRAWIASGLFVVLLYQVGPALGQTPAPAPRPAPAPPAPANGVSIGDVASLLQIINNRFDTMDRRLGQLEATSAPLARLAAKLPLDDPSALTLRQPDSAVAGLDTKLQDLAAEVRELRAALERSAPSGAGPNSTTASSVQSGVVELVNEMGSDQKIRVDGRLYTVPAQTVANVTVPVGTVTTELVGYESPKTWTIGAPNFRQCVRITPREVQVTRVEDSSLMVP